MAEDIINALTVIYGLFKMSRSSPEFQEHVDREVMRIVSILQENFLLYEKKE
jgi:hypothetical protein